MSVQQKNRVRIAISNRVIVMGLVMLLVLAFTTGFAWIQPEQVLLHGHN